MYHGVAEPSLFIEFFFIKILRNYINYQCFTVRNLNFMVAPCISNIKHFIVQLMHTNYKIRRLLK